MSEDERFVKAVRAGCSRGFFGIHDICQYPDCICEEVPNGISAALASYTTGNAETISVAAEAMQAKSRPDALVDSYANFLAKVALEAVAHKHREKGG